MSFLRHIFGTFGSYTQLLGGGYQMKDIRNVVGMGDDISDTKVLQTIFMEYADGFQAFVCFEKLVRAIIEEDGTDVSDREVDLTTFLEGYAKHQGNVRRGHEIYWFWMQS